MVSCPPGSSKELCDSPSPLASLSPTAAMTPSQQTGHLFLPKSFGQPELLELQTDNQWWFCGASPQMAGNNYMVSRGSIPSFGLEQALEGDFIFKKKTFNLMNAANQIYYYTTCWEENLHHRVN